MKLQHLRSTLSYLIILTFIAKLNSVKAQKIQPRIIGGRVTTQDNAGGFVVNLRYDGRFFCGGTLVRPNFVITAAHCIYGYRGSIRRITVQGGVTYLTQRGVLSKISKIMYPSSFTPQSLNNDIAVLKLRSPMTNLPTAPICNIRLRRGDRVHVSGWGSTSANSERPSRKLRKVQLTLLRKSRCQNAYRKTEKLMSSTFCAYGRGRDTCVGDSGGGVIFNNELCGIVSWGLGCANKLYPGVYTSIEYMRPFIFRCLNK